MAPLSTLCLLAALCLCTGLAQECPPIDDGYELFPSYPASRYKLPIFNLDWGVAMAACQGDGGGSHLVVINSDVEAAVVRELMTRLAGSEIPFAHVGIDDLVTEGRWVTVQGGLVSASGYNKWAFGYPNGGTGANCGVVAVDGLYRDAPCSTVLPFICEKPNV